MPDSTSEGTSAAVLGGEDAGAAMVGVVDPDEVDPPDVDDALHAEDDAIVDPTPELVVL